MKRPAFQFYAGDWRSNVKLRRCTYAERGVWIEVLCLLHDSDEYGLLRWPLREIAEGIGCRFADLKALATKHVIKGGDTQIEQLVYRPRHAGKAGAPVILLAAQVGPLWYSSRMVRDEYIREHRGEATRFVAPNTASKDTPIGSPTARQGETPTLWPGDGASTASSSSVLRTSPSERPEQDADPWLIGKEFLIKRGVAQSTVGGFIAALARDHGRENVIKAIQAAIVEEPADVKSYIVGILRGKTPGSRWDPTKYNAEKQA